MPDEDNVIDVEAEEIPDSADSLPAVIPKPRSNHAVDDGENLSSEIPMIRPKPPQWSAEWWEQASPDVQSRRCRAKNAKGARCQRIAIDGATVCYTHGGAAPHVRAAARARIENASDRMARNQISLAETADSETVRFAATKDLLDRAGLKPPTTVEIGPTKPYEEVLGDVFEGISTMTRAESRRARGLPDEDGNQPAVAYAEGVGGLPPTHGNPDLPNQPLDQHPRRKPMHDPTTSAGDGDHGTPPDTESHSVTSVSADSTSARYATHKDSHAEATPPPQPRRARFDRQAQPQAPVRHITGDDAIAAANAANRAIGALPEPLALPSPHKRYRRP